MTSARVESTFKSALKAGACFATAMLTSMITGEMCTGSPSVYPDWGIALFWLVVGVFGAVSIALIVYGLKFAHKTITAGRTTGKRGSYWLTIGYGLKAAGFIPLAGAMFFWTYHMFTDNTVVSGNAAGLELIFMVALIASGIALILQVIVVFGQAKRSRQLQAAV